MGPWQESLQGALLPGQLDDAGCAGAHAIRGQHILFTQEAVQHG